MRRTRLKTKQRSRYTDGHCAALLCGADYQFAFSPWGYMPTRDDPDGKPQESNWRALADEIRDAWMAMRDEILPAWIAEHPGCRPWAWWVFDAPERRRCISGQHPYDDPAWRGEKRLTFGKPSWHTFAQFESQVQYLHRLDLLTPAELAAMPFDLPDGTP